MRGPRSFPTQKPCRCVLGAISVLAALTTNACEDPLSRTSTVTRTTLGDTLVVTTDPGPDPGGPLYTVERDLTIGEFDGPEEYVLSASSVSADEEGRIYVSGQRAGDIRIFDARGQYLRSFGRRGDGPGEFNSNSWGWFRVRPVAGQRITVEDLPRLRVFDLEGTYLSSFDLLFVGPQDQRRFARPRGIEWLPERGMVVARWSPTLPDGSSGESLVLLDDSLAVLREFPVREERGGSYDGDGWGLTLPHAPAYAWALAGNQILAWGVSDEYRIDMYDLATGAWTRAVFLLPAEPVTREDIQAFKGEFLSRDWVQGQEEVWEPRLNRAVYPEVKPHFASLVGDDQGRIWVERYAPIPGPAGEEWVRYDLFDSDGRWLGIVDSPGAFEYIRDGYGYRIGGEDFPRVERYRLVGNDSAGIG